MDTGTQIRLETMRADEAQAQIGALAALLHDVVHAGASINFILPFSHKEAEAFWTGKVLPAMRDGSRIVLVARDGARIAGSVQLSTDTPPNQPHRADVTKLLVHPDYRRRGIARALMAELEQMALGRFRTLITLDTRSGDFAEPLYASMGYIVAGTIPGYCRDPIEDRLDATTIMYKQL